MNKRMILFALLLLGIQYVSGQDALSSVNINICNVQLSSNAKTLSYDVYLRSTNKDTVVAVPGFVFRLAIPQADLGTSEKVISLSNTTKELGSCAETITASGNDWIMKFLNGIFVQSYSTALVVSTEYPGTRIGTVNVSNADGSAYKVPIKVNLNFTDTQIKTKSTCAIFKPNTTYLAPNSTTGLPQSSFMGLGAYTLSPISESTFTVTPNPATREVRVSIGNRTLEVIIYDLNGKKVISQTISESAIVNISSLPVGMYTIEVNGNQKKLVKK